MLELADTREAGGLLNEAERVEGLDFRIRRHRRMKKPVVRYRYAAEKLPKSLQLGTQHTVGRSHVKAFEPFLKIAWAENSEQHRLLIVLLAALNPDLRAQQGVRAVAPNQIVTSERPYRRAILAADRNTNCFLLLLHPFGSPAKQRVHHRQCSEFFPQHAFHLILGQALVVLGIKRPHDLSPGGRMPIFAHQIAIGSELSDRISLGHQPRRPEFLFDAPIGKVFERSLRKILPFWNSAQRRARLNKCASDAAQPEHDCQTKPDRPSAHDHDWVVLQHRAPLSRTNTVSWAYHCVLNGRSLSPRSRRRGPAVDDRARRRGDRAGAGNRESRTLAWRPAHPG